MTHSTIKRAQKHVRAARDADEYGMELLESREPIAAARELGEAGYEWSIAVMLLVEWAQS